MLARSPLILATLAALIASACADAEPDFSGDTSAPLLSITSPERGTRSSEETILVEGYVSDDESGIASVSVSGVEAELAEDGHFSVELAPTSGLALLRVIARDRAGNESQRTRALLVGQFASPNETVPNAAQVYIGKQTLEAIAETGEEVVGGLDIESLLASANPVLSAGSSSCLNATVDLEQVSYDDLAITLEPVDGGIRALVRIDGLHAEAIAHHKVACIGGNTRIEIDADGAEVETELSLAVSGGALVAHVETSEARFEDLQVDVGILPSSVIEFVVGELDTKLGEKLSELMSRELPPIVETNVDRLSMDHELVVLGKSLNIKAEPSSVQFNQEGGTITIATRVAAPGAGKPYLSNPMPPPALQTQLGLSALIADDAVNQALSAIWDTGALNRSLSLTTESGADIGGGILDSLRISAPLPPVMGADSEDKSLKLTIGDLSIDLLKEGETKPVSRVAISLEIAVSVTESAGELRFQSTGAPTIYMDRLDSDGFLNDRDLEVLVAFASTMLTGDLNSLLGEIPLPSFAGTSLANAAVLAEGGYLQVGANLVR